MKPHLPPPDSMEDAQMVELYTCIFGLLTLVFPLYSGLGHRDCILVIYNKKNLWAVTLGGSGPILRQYRRKGVQIKGKVFGSQKIKVENGRLKLPWLQLSEKLEIQAESVE